MWPAARSGRYPCAGRAVKLAFRPMESDTIIDHGVPVRQFSVLLQNRAGALAAMVKLLRTNRIEVIGLSMQDSRDATVARLVASDPDATAQSFMEKGIP